MHEEAGSLANFRSMLKESGSEFPDSFVENLDRLVLSMHPKYKKKTHAPTAAAAVNGKGKGKAVETILDEEAERQRRLFPGLAMQDSEWQPSFQPDPEGAKVVVDGFVDDLMSQLEQGAAKHAGDKRKRSISPPRVNGGGRRRSPDYEGSRGGYDARGRQPRPIMDDRPILYKIYPGKVTGIKDFGAFVSIASLGVDGPDVVQLE